MERTAGYCGQRGIREKASQFGTTQKALRAELEKGEGKERLRDLLIAESTLGYLVDISRNDLGL